MFIPEDSYEPVADILFLSLVEPASISRASLSQTNKAVPLSLTFHQSPDGLPVLDHTGDLDTTSAVGDTCDAVTIDGVKRVSVGDAAIGDVTVNDVDYAGFTLFQTDLWIQCRMPKERLTRQLP